SWTESVAGPCPTLPAHRCALAGPRPGFPSVLLVDRNDTSTHPGHAETLALGIPCDTRCVLMAISRPARRAMPTTASNSARGKDAMKGSQKPKKLGKKPAQKTLKERRT